MMLRWFKWAVVVGVGVAVVGVALHEVAPAALAPVLSHPGVRAATHALHKLVRDTVYPSLAWLSGDRRTPQAATRKGKKDKLFTEEELRQYDGREGRKGPYLALMGRVYNVKKGKQHYGPGGGYEFFAGRDASRAFVSGDFTEEGLVDDIRGLTDTDYLGLEDWVKFYEKDYKYVGKLIGRYYDGQGEPTPYNLESQGWFTQAFRSREDRDREKERFPPCNSEWSPNTGARLWCTQRSGGVVRDWVGVPRKLFNPGQGKSRCACVRTSGPPSHDPSRTNHQDRGDLDNPNLQEYAGCPPDQASCTVKDDD